VLHGTSGILVQDNVAFHVYGNCYYLEVSRLIAYVCCNNSFAGCQIALQTAAHATLALATVKNLSHRHEQPFGAVCKLFLLAAGLAKQLSGNVLVFRMELRSTTGSSTTLPAGGYDQTGTLHVQVCAVDRPQAGISKCTGRLPGLGPPQAPESSILAVLAQAAGFSILQLHG